MSFSHPKLPTIGTQEIADLLRIKPATFRRRLPALYAAGFPKPLAHCRSAWSRNLVLAWIDQREPAAEAPSDPIEQASAELDRRLNRRDAA